MISRFYLFFLITTLLTQAYALNKKDYQTTVQQTQIKIDQLIKKLKTYPEKSSDQRIAFIAQSFSDLPYLAAGAMGEGDWQPKARAYVGGALHIKQYPVYRVDGFDCQTLVQVMIALLHADNLKKFDQHILKIAYGAAGNPHGEIVRYFNRNNFIEGDFNPINEKNGYLEDVTSMGPLAKESTKTSVMLTRNNWFSNQQKNINKTVVVLDEKNHEAMVKRFRTIYAALDFPHFKSEKISLSYIPKKKLALIKADGSYQPNQILLNKIPTPAVLEIVRDTKKWMIQGKNIAEHIGSELSVSHIGILYRKKFKKGDLIYQKIKCANEHSREKQCKVVSVFCEKKVCSELMLVHATQSHPDGYYWYTDEAGHQLCRRNVPSEIKDKSKYSSCNRVERIPFFAYLTNFQYGKYWYMASPSILGVHVERIN